MAIADTTPKIYPTLSEMLNQKGLKNPIYSTFKNILLSEYNIPVPGLAYTSLRGVTANQMTPQGICCTGSYLLVTSYCHGSSTVYSSLAILRLNGSYVKTIGIKMNIHAGGIAYHKPTDYVWISANTSKDTCAKVLRVPLSTLLKMNEGAVLSSLQYDLYSFPGLKSASYLTIHENQLYIGYCNTKNNSGADFYMTVIDSSGNPLAKNSDQTMIRPLYSYTAKSYIQGLCIIKTDSGTYAIFSQSYGRRNTGLASEKGSKLLVYDYNRTDTDFNRPAEKSIPMPAMIEQIYPYGTSVLFAVFESASNAYYQKNIFRKTSRSINQIDRICALDLYKILP